MNTPSKISIILPRVSILASLSIPHKYSAKYSFEIGNFFSLFTAELSNEIMSDASAIKLSSASTNRFKSFQYHSMVFPSSNVIVTPK